jgi:hypothetical protein
VGLALSLPQDQSLACRTWGTTTQQASIMVTRPCRICPRPKTRRSSAFCYWHWLMRQPIELQIRHAEWRRSQYQGPERPRVPKKEWPEGERWCSGCQAFVPDEYTRGSRCRAHASQAAHASHISRIYDITEAQYQELLNWQGGRCYICGNRPRTGRLAVDHDHQTGAVRGLLCANDDWGCNRNLARLLYDLDAARRLVQYIELAPWERLRAGEPPPVLTTQPVVDDEPAPF